MPLPPAPALPSPPTRPHPLPVPALPLPPLSAAPAADYLAAQCAACKPGYKEPAGRCRECDAGYVFNTTLGRCMPGGRAGDWQGGPWGVHEARSLFCRCAVTCSLSTAARRQKAAATRAQPSFPPGLPALRRCAVAPGPALELLPPLPSPDVTPPQLFIGDPSNTDYKYSTYIGYQLLPGEPTDTAPV
jgi:hypothetical protein